MRATFKVRSPQAAGKLPPKTARVLREPLPTENAFCSPRRQSLQGSLLSEHLLKTKQVGRGSTLALTDLRSRSGKKVNRNPEK
jgi:hypothetical protein